MFLFTSRHRTGVIGAMVLLLLGSALACNLPGRSTPTVEASIQAPGTPLPPALPTSLPQPTATHTPPPDVVFEGVSFSYADSLATRIQTKVIPALPPEEDAPYWMLVPEYLEFSFEGYPLQNTFHPPPH